MDNNNKPRNVLKREEYEILALKNHKNQFLTKTLRTALAEKPLELALPIMYRFEDWVVAYQNIV